MIFFIFLLIVEEIEKEKEKKPFIQKKEKSSNHNGRLHSNYDQYSAFSDCEESIPNGKSSRSSSKYNRSKSMETLSTSTSDISRKGEFKMCIPTYLRILIL